MSNQEITVDVASGAGVVHKLGRGRCSAQLAEGLQEVVEAVQLLGRKGKVSLELTVELANKDSDRDKIFISYDVQPKPPKPDAPTDMLYVNPETNGLQHNDPQLTIGDVLRETPTAPSEAKPTPAASGRLRTIGDSQSE